MGVGLVCRAIKHTGAIRTTLRAQVAGVPFKRMWGRVPNGTEQRPCQTFRRCGRGCPTWFGGHQARSAADARTAHGQVWMLGMSGVLVKNSTPRMSVVPATHQTTTTIARVHTMSVCHQARLEQTPPSSHPCNTYCRHRHPRHRHTELLNHTSASLPAAITVQAETSSISSVSRDTPHFDIEARSRYCQVETHRTSNTSSASTTGRHRGPRPLRCKPIRAT